MHETIEILKIEIMEQMMFKPTFDYDVIKQRIENENPRIEVVKIKYMNMPSYDSQTFCVLEWFNQREYCIRMYYNHLNLDQNASRQRLGQGSGGYLQLFNREGDKQTAIEEFDKTAKLYKEDM